MNVFPSIHKSVSESLVNHISESTGISPGTEPFLPVFTVQPTNQSVPEDDTATFVAVAVGYPSPTYHWMVNINDGFGFVGDLDFDPSGTLVLENVTPSMDGYQYRCTATNSEGTVNSNTVTLTVT